MRPMVLQSFLLLCLATVVKADIYCHAPRCSNNRLNEATQDRKNANRIFDSQNNNKGGYNVGDKTDKKFADSSGTANKYASQYNMEHFQGSLLRLEWTNQHGCGGDEDSNPNKLNCNFVLQYMCQKDVKDIGAETIRNGVDTGTNGYTTPKEDEKQSDYNSRKNKNTKEKGMHEGMEWYDKCTQRERNKGLFTADQDLKKNRDRAINTRQNNAGTRRGYECPEERDYFPYWHPTPWKDIAVFATNQSMCEYYHNNSHNIHPRHECVEKWPGSQTVKHYSRFNNEKDCKAAKGEWTLFHNYLEKAPTYKTQQACEDADNTWGRPLYGLKEECLVPLKAPHCEEAPWTRVNHLGNGAKGDLQTPNYMWQLPKFPSGDTQRCIYRIRYNISTDDYEPWGTDYKLNGDAGYDYISNDPKVDIGASNIELQLNINTAQFGRTFQDRSHVFKIRARPAVAGIETKTIHNIIVRGKRGNIVQAFPAVEYDFSPTNARVKVGDLVHMQWTGSNSHNNGGGGDGQAGDAGEGTGGTDRNNCVPMPDDRGLNFPLLSEQDNLFKHVNFKWAASEDLHKGYTPTYVDIWLQHASAGHYVCGLCNSDHSLKKKGKDKDKKMDGKMNNAPASFGGMLLEVTTEGVYNYMCTRNNNFSNRSQKASIIVESA